MKWVQRNPIPEICENCVQEDCYNCDVACERWKLSEEDALRISRRMMVRAVERLERKIAEIDAQLKR